MARTYQALKEAGLKEWVSGLQNAEGVSVEPILRNRSRLVGSHPAVARRTPGVAAVTVSWPMSRWAFPVNVTAAYTPGTMTGRRLRQ